MNIPQENRRKEDRRVADREEKEERKAAAEAMQRTLRWLTWSTAALFLVICGLGLKIYLDGRTTHDALCTFRADLAQKVLTGTEFLKAHPEGLPGFPASAILESIGNQQKAVIALRTLDCAAIPVPKAATSKTP